MLPPSTIKDAAVFIYGHPRSRAVLLSLLGSLMLSKVLCQCWRYYSNKNKLKSKQAELSKKRAVVEAQLLNKDVQFYEEILSKTAPELVEALKNGDMFAVDVLRAYQCKALELTDSINCVAEFITEAEENAKALDALPDKKGLLYGVPVSIKENINIAGYESTGGVECLIGSVAKEDAVIVKLLRKHGAIPFARTNLPQTMLSYSCTNYIYGETTNPQDKTRSPGGSSGGEAAMLGGGGSVIGVGTDLGGSVRIPADFCGVYSLKLTRGRIQGKGVLTFTKGNLGILGVLGPMARDFDSLLLLSQALLSPEMIELDRSLPNLPFDPQVYEKKTPLRIGYYTFDGVLQCQPPVVRAVMEAKAALESMGHQEVVSSRGNCSFMF
ncbi:vitamin D3 hydroxylase-associated protein-like [Physella acuta]|uniref:vitamin D3 hydroxylase-associated protein-like n=1 Tax=Physella acuta TaxID=109671 RepID=UPI0027DDAD32|nr:vitamin D3 hydroxylase-associated protein-like [Physella acuta]